MKKLINASPNDQIVTSQDIVTSIDASATNQQVPSALSVKTALEGAAGGGFEGFTVTFSNTYSMTGVMKPTSAPFYFIQADGTKVEVDCKDSTLKGRIIKNVVLIQSGVWVGNYQDIDFSSSGATSWSDHSTKRGLWLDVGGVSYGILPLVSVSSPSSFIPFNNGESTPYNQLFLPGDATITHANGGIPCLLKGTLVRLANGNDKPIEEITYEDNLLVWDFDNGKLSSAKPLWIKKAQPANYYFKNILASGKELLTTGQSSTGWGHRMFDMDKGKFRYTTETVSDRIFTLDGVDLHKSCERIEDECEHYNIITDHHFNLFANGILTSCSYNNLYPIKDMKFVKEERNYRSIDMYDVPEKYYSGLRLSEQTFDIESVNKYVKNLETLEVKHTV